MISLVQECDKAYSKELKITQFFDTRITSKISKDALGIYTTLSKDLFIKNNAVAFVGLADIGRKIATGENRLLTKEIVKGANIAEVNEQEFFSNIEEIFQQSSGKKALFIGDIYDFEYDSFKWRGTKEYNKYNENLFKSRNTSNHNEIVFADEKNSYHIQLAYADGSKDSYLIFFNTEDVKVNYNKHSIESECSYIKSNNTYYEFIHYYKDESLRNKIIEEGFYEFSENVQNIEDKHFELNQQIGFKAYSLPEVENVNYDSLVVYKLVSDNKKEKK